MTRNPANLGFQKLIETTEGRTKLTKIVTKMLSHWNLTTREQLLLLGLNETSRYMLSRYKNNESILPNEQDKLERVGLLLAIYESLYALFPENESLRFSWIKRRNQSLNNQKPIDIMLEQGLIGIAKILWFLDYQKVQ